MNGGWYDCEHGKGLGRCPDCANADPAALRDNDYGRQLDKLDREAEQGLAQFHADMAHAKMFHPEDVTIVRRTDDGEVIGYLVNTGEES